MAEERGSMGKRCCAEAEDSFAEVIKGGGSIGVGRSGTGAREIEKGWVLGKKGFAYG